MRRPAVCSRAAIDFEERLEAVYPVAEFREHRILLHVGAHRTIGIAYRSPQESVNLGFVLILAWFPFSSIGQ